MQWLSETNIMFGKIEFLCLSSIMLQVKAATFPIMHLQHAMERNAKWI